MPWSGAERKFRGPLKPIQICFLSNMLLDLIKEKFYFWCLAKEKLSFWWIWVCVRVCVCVCVCVYVRAHARVYRLQLGMSQHNSPAVCFTKLLWWLLPPRWSRNEREEIQWGGVQWYCSHSCVAGCLVLRFTKCLAVDWGQRADSRLCAGPVLSFSRECAHPVPVQCLEHKNLLWGASHLGAWDSTTGKRHSFGSHTFPQAPLFKVNGLDCR
jgi:hypothetical protein